MSIPGQIDQADATQAHDVTSAGVPRLGEQRPSVAADLFSGLVRLDRLAIPSGRPGRLPDAEELFLRRVTHFCEQHVDAVVIEREDRIPDHVIEGLKDIGAFCVTIPRRYGGLGLSVRCYLRTLMVVSSVHPALSELLAAHQAIGLPQPILLFGTDRQKRRYLPRCAREISAFALTEPEIGNDPYRIRTTATPGPGSGSYTLDGVKLWITNGVIADLLVVLAAVPASAGGPGGMTAFVVEADAAGVTVEHRCSFVGLRGLENGVIRLDSVVVDVENRIGNEGQGLEIALAAQDASRLSLPAVCAATAKWSLKIAREWAGIRVQWGRPIGQHDAVAGKLAFIAATTFALEAIVEVTARRQALHDTDTRLDAELAKLFASEKAWLVVDELLQIRGGRGYETAESAAARGERGVPVEQVWRDVRIGRIFDGSSEVLRVFLAQAVVDRHDVNARQSTVDPDHGAMGGDHLAGYTRLIGAAARRLADEVDQVAEWSTAERDGRQRHLGRIVDIGAELYAMSAACSYADARSGDDGAPMQLADAFCAQAMARVQELFERLSTNTDDNDRAVARQVLEGRHTWLEHGILDPSIDGPWIADQPPATGRTVRRRCPSGSHGPTDATDQDREAR